MQKQQLDAWIRFVREFAIPQLQEAIRTGDIATKTDILKTFASVKESSGRIAIMPNASIPSRGSNASVSGLFNVYIIKINAVELRAFEYCGLQFMCLFLDGDNTEESDRKGQKCDVMLANHAELVRQLLAALDGD